MSRNVHGAPRTLAATMVRVRPQLFVCALAVTTTAAISTRAATSAAVSINAERSKELAARLRKRQAVQDPPEQHYKVPQFPEAIDGEALDGSPLAEQLRSQAEEAALRAERAAAAAEWRAWIAPATERLAHEYIAFVDEVHGAQEYHADNGLFFAQMSDAVNTHWSPDRLLQRVAASRLLQPSLRERMQIAAEQGHASPLSTSDAPAVWALFYASVRALLQSENQQDVTQLGAAQSTGRWRRSLQYRLLRRLRSAMERQRRFNRRFPAPRSPGA